LCIGCCFCVVINEQLLLARILSHFSEFMTFPVFYGHGSNNFCWKHLTAGSISFILCCHSTSISNPFHITWTF
jgi:hypothetical protein